MGSAEWEYLGELALTHQKLGFRGIFRSPNYKPYMYTLKAVSICKSKDELDEEIGSHIEIMFDILDGKLGGQYAVDRIRTSSLNADLRDREKARYAEFKKCRWGDALDTSDMQSLQDSIRTSYVRAILMPKSGEARVEQYFALPEEE